MFRTLFINRGERISCRDSWLVVSCDGEEKKLPLEDIYSIVIDNQASYITIPTIVRLTENGSHILICNEKHQPVSVILPQDRHYRPLDVIRRQLDMGPDFKNQLWDSIVRAKIRNQAAVLRLCGCGREPAERLERFSLEVEGGDEGNREAVAAKMFFRSLYGSAFIRFADDGINAALNYGYAVIRSSVAKTLTAYGYNCVIGLHHINEYNPFNLADDLMEPLRPLVDLWVDDHHEELLDELTKDQRIALAAIVNETMLWDGKKMKMRNALDKYISSLTSAVERHDVSLLKIPVIGGRCLVNEDE